jgi:hypothetical protein
MRKRERADRDFYRTPVAAVDLANDLMDHNLKWWEPCAGDGAISSRLENIVFSSDIHPMAKGIKKLDVMSCKKPTNIDAVITNPPFFLAYNILDRCLFEWKIPALLLLRIEPLSTQKRNSYTKYLSHMNIVSSLIKFETETGRIVHGNGTIRCAWCLFQTKKVKYTITKWVTFEKTLSELFDLEKSKL